MIDFNYSQEIWTDPSRKISTWIFHTIRPNSSDQVNENRFAFLISYIWVLLLKKTIIVGYTLGIIVLFIFLIFK